MSSNGKIEDEATYKNSLDWMVEKALKLEDPLLDPEVRVKLQQKYDLVERRIQEFRRGQLVKKFPGLREQYRILGLTYQEDVPPLEDETEPAEVPEKLPEAKSPAGGYKAPVEAAGTPAEPAASRLSAWLDD